MTDLQKVELALRRLAEKYQHFSPGTGPERWFRDLADQIVKDEAARRAENAQRAIAGKEG